MVLHTPEAPCDPLDLPPLPTEGPFAWFTERRTLWTTGPLCIDWRVAERVWLRLQVASDGPLEVTAGLGPGNPIPDRLGTVYLRAEGKRRSFRSLLEVHRGFPGGRRAQ